MRVPYYYIYTIKRRCERFILYDETTILYLYDTCRRGGVQR